MGRSNGRTLTFEARFVSGGKVKSAIIEARDHKRAERKAQEFPHLLSVEKIGYKAGLGLLATKLTDDLMKDIAQPRMSPIAMDEFLWLRRNKRIQNKVKDNLDK
jgi:hypothetical protein